MKVFFFFVAFLSCILGHFVHATPPSKPVALLHLDKGEPITGTDGRFTVAAINKGRADGFFEGRLLDIRRTLQNQDRVVGYARIIEAEDQSSFLAVESPVGLVLAKDDRFTLSEAEHDSSGFKFVSETGHRGPLTFASFFDQDRLLLTANHSEFIIWDWRSGRKVQDITNWYGVLFRAMSLDRRANKLHILNSSTLYEWDLAKMEIAKAIHLSGTDSNPVPKLLASSDGSVIVHTARRNVRVLDAKLTETGQIGPDETLGDMHWQIDLSRDGRLLLTTHVRLETGPNGLVSPRSLVLWDTKQNKVIRKIVEQKHDPSIVRFVPLQDTIVYDADDGQLTFVSLSGHILASKAVGPNRISGLEFSPDGKVFVTSHSDGEVRLWQYPSLESKLISDEGQAEGATEGSPIAFTSDGVHFAVGLKNNAVGIWELSTRKLIHKLEGFSQNIISILPSKDGKRLVVAKRDGLETWDLNSGSVSALTIPNLRFAAIGPVSGQTIGVRLAEERKYYSAIPGVFEPDTLELSIWKRASRTDAFTWGQREIEDYAVTPNEKYLVRADVWRLSIWNLVAGSMIDSRSAVTDEEYAKFYAGKGKSAGDASPLFGKVQVSNDGSRLAYGINDGFFHIWEFESGKLGKEVYTKKFVELDGFALSPDFETLVTVGAGKVTVTAVSTDKTLYEFTKPGIQISKITWNPEGTKFSIAADSNAVHVYARSDGAGLYSKHFTDQIADVAFSPDGVFMYISTSGGQIHVLRADSGDLTAQLVTQEANGGPEVVHRAGEKWRAIWRITCYISHFGCESAAKSQADRHWLVFNESSQFDSFNLSDAPKFSWVATDDPLRAIAPEIFMRDYYEPRLLPRLLACHEGEASGDAEACKKAFKPVRSLTELNRIQPEVKIVGVRRGLSADEMLVDVEVTGKEDATQKNDKTKTAVYDLRLFRDGQIVGQWPEPTGGIAGAEDIEKWRAERLVPMEDGKTSTLHRFVVHLAHRDKGQPVKLTAYAFNEDRVKSETASDDSYKVPDDTAPAKPRAYAITIGVNAYQNTNWKLGFAVKDAEDLSAALRQIEGYEVISVPLASGEHGGSKLDQATKANIEDVLGLLGGRGDAQRGRLKGVIGPVTDKLQRASPDDLVILSFSGHGTLIRRVGSICCLPTRAQKARSLMLVCRSSSQATSSASGCGKWMLARW